MPARRHSGSAYLDQRAYTGYIAAPPGTKGCGLAAGERRWPDNIDVSTLFTILPNKGRGVLPVHEDEGLHGDAPDPTQA